MKKALICIICVILGIGIGTVGCLILTDPQENEPSEETRSTTCFSDGTVSVNSGTLSSLALQVAAHIKNGDFDSLASMVHPEYGLILSPYATVNLSSNLSFTPKQVAVFDSDSNSYTWGLSVDALSPIVMTVSEYFKEYVFDYDYTTCGIIGVNTIIKTGNSLENITDVFPGAQFVDLCNPGTSDNEYMNWSTLRLVFEEYNSCLMLTAIIHSEYTI